MLKSSKHVAEQLGVHRTSVNRIIREHPEQFASVVKTGKRNAIFISDEGIELLKEYFQPKQGTEHDSVETKADLIESVQSRLKHEIELLQSQLKHALENAHINLSKVEQEKEYFKNKLVKEEEERRTLQWQITEMQHRHDTIVMSLTNRLEDIQKRLPELPAPENKKPGVLRRFLSWFTAPEEKPVHWEQTELFRKAN